MNYASTAYAKIAKEVAGPRELEASLLLRAAAKLQGIAESWKDKRADLNDALLYNRRLWTIFLDSMMREDNRLPAPLSENLKTLGAFVMCETFSMMTAPRQKHLDNLININRRIATGLRGRR
jgi:flagellar biosynthesis activator protein FlaF